ncbi:hypothetical protein E4U24_003984 [Claviceps purpurea]|nr:hypothetical protein E4U24_003984 [Claviceps purpurea]
MAGAFPLVESSSMEYTTTEEKVVYWPGAPRLGELVADDPAVVRPGGGETRRRVTGTGKEIYNKRRSAPSEQALGMGHSRNRGGTGSPAHRMRQLAGHGPSQRMRGRHGSKSQLATN